MIREGDRFLGQAVVGIVDTYIRHHKDPNKSRSAINQLAQLIEKDPQLEADCKQEASVRALSLYFAQGVDAETTEEERRKILGDTDPRGISRTFLETRRAAEERVVSLTSNGHSLNTS